MPSDPEAEGYADSIADPLGDLCAALWLTVALRVAADAYRAVKGGSDTAAGRLEAPAMAALAVTVGRWRRKMAREGAAAVEKVERDNRAWAASQARAVGREGYRPESAALRDLYRRKMDGDLMASLDDLEMLDSSGRWRPVGSAYSDLVRGSLRRHPDDPESAIGEVTRALRKGGGLRIRRPGLTERGRQRPSLDVESRVRLDVVNNVNRYTQDIRDQVGRDLGLTSVKISAHSCPAPDHARFQGRVYTREQFDRIQGSLARPIGSFNCRHITFPAPDGASPSYSEAELRGMAESSTRPVSVRVGGREVERTRYEWSQEMRRLETGVRRDKANAMVMEAAGESGAADRKRARDRAALCRRVAAETGLPYRPERMRVRRLS